MVEKNLPKILADLAAEVDQGFLEETYEVKGHKYLLRLLSDGETNWKNRYIDGLASPLSMMSQRKSATLAVALRAIDGTDVISMYAPPAITADSTDVEKAESERWGRLNSLDKQFEVARKLYEYIARRPAEFSTGLYAKFQELEERRDEVISNLKKS